MKEDKSYSMNFLACQAALEAYEDEPQDLQDFAIVREDLRVVGFSDGERLYLGVRGSKNFDNWLRNFRYYPSRIAGIGIVHAGFKAAANKLLPDVRSLLSDTAHKLVFSGHSMGGAIASILAETLAKDGIYSNVRAFGAPRHWGRFVNLKCDTIAFQIDDDPVPGLPPRTPIGMFYGHKGRIVTIDDPGIISVGDHSINRYMEHIKKFEKAEK